MSSGDILEEGVYCADISNPHGRTSVLCHPEWLSLYAEWLSLYAVSTSDHCYLLMELLISSMGHGKTTFLLSTNKKVTLMLDRQCFFVHLKEGAFTRKGSRSLLKANQMEIARCCGIFDSSVKLQDCGNKINLGSGDEVSN